MHPLFAITIFTAIFSLAECKKYHPNNIPGDVCSPENSTWMRTLLMNAKCKSRPMLVELAPLEGYEFNPPLIMVNQCSGFCANINCLPVRTKNVTHYVRRIPLTGPRKGMDECSALQIEEHETCRCMCRMTEANCKAGQIFDRLNCECKCNDHVREKAECEVQFGMKWMEDICKCKCMRMNTECSGDTTWDHSLCQCVATP